MPQRANPTPAPNTTLQQALALHRQGRLAEAERLYRAALAKRPRQFELLHWFGLLRLQQDDAAEALTLLRAAAEVKPRATEVLPGLGAALAGLGRLEEALTAYERILGASPGDVDAHYNRGIVLSRLGRHAEALEAYDKALTLRSNHVPALFNRGNVLAMLSRFDEALANYDDVIALAPRHVDAFHNRANALKALGRYDEAIAAYDRVLGIAPRHADALNNRGNTLFALKRFGEAIANLQAALAVTPGDRDVWFNLGRALQESDRDLEAIAAFDRALAVRPADADALYSRGNSLIKLSRPADAAVDYEKAFASDPAHPYVFAALLRARYDICDWPEVARLASELPARLRDATTVIEPFQLFCLPTTPADQLHCARTYKRSKTRGLQLPSATPRARSHDRIRLGYFSADFRVHVVALAIAGLFELHDRKRFELIGISYGPDDHSEFRGRLIRAFDQFHDVRAKGDEEIAALMRELEIDIVVDLTGYTRESRSEILARRPAPIQVGYLGFPGTTGAEFIDYVIADAVVLPLEQQPFYTEKIVRLPDCYLVNDARNMHISARVPSRGELGLPPHGFVFCAFTQNYKISAAVFDIWMRLLLTVEDSVLWLSRTTEAAMTNLRREARARGVDPARLAFAPAVDLLPDHLARQRQADLYLDTLPYNAHTTASNALWAGLPVLSCAGTTFAGRVAASVLQAAGLPELVTHSLEEYEALALSLASDRTRLESLRRKLADNRPTCPLFDAERFCRHLETAYLTMWDIYRRGEAPRSFRVEPTAEGQDSRESRDPGQPGSVVAERARRIVRPGFPS
jgi:protein O-GlcNAc transferase